MLLRAERMTGVHPDLKRVMELAAERTPWPIGVIEGVRSPERQKSLIAQGASHTMRSRHIPSPNDNLAKAVDVGPAPQNSITFAWPLYDKLAVIVKATAAELNVPIEWGGDWTSFRDGPHWQLPWEQYP